MKNYYNILLAIALLICLLPMPYGYYILIRYISAIVFAIMAYDYYCQKQKELFIITLGLTLLFQPFIRIPLGRDVWNVVDVIVAIFLIFLFLKKKNPQ